MAINKKDMDTYYLPNNTFAKNTKNFLNYYFIVFCFILIIIFYNDTIINDKLSTPFKIILGMCFIIIYASYPQIINYIYNNHSTKYKQQTKSNIQPDIYLSKLLNQHEKISKKAPKEFNKLRELIKDFLLTHHILLSNNRKNTLTKTQLKISINDLRDQLERILKYSQTLIHLMPHDKTYLDEFFIFNQLLKQCLSNYYNEIISIYGINDHTHQYELLRSSENKYGYVDMI
jgi:hypothetical protein